MAENKEYFVKKCKICGDNALGFNFNVLTCESCKAFFRRNAFKNVKPCRNQSKCVMNKSKRSYCSHCRLSKCFECGMKKEWILNENQRRVRKAIGITYQGHGKAKSTSESLNEDGQNKYQDESHNSASHLLIYSLSQMYETIDQMLLHDDQDYEKVQSVQPYTESPKSHKSEDKSQTKDQLMVSVSRPITDYSNTLTETEGYYLTELLEVTNKLRTPVGTITSEAVTFTDAIQVMHYARVMDTKNLIVIPKSLAAFKRMSPEDRIDLIGQGIIDHMAIMRTVTGFFEDGKMPYLTVPTMIDKFSTCLVPLNVIRQKKPYLYSATLNFYEKMGKEWDSDYVILDLMSAIILFNPYRTSDYRAISERQYIYKYLLKRYLFMKYKSEEKTNQKYSRLMASIDLVHILCENRRKNAIEENYHNIYGVSEHFALLRLVVE